MYADRLEGEIKLPIQNRLNGNASVSNRTVTGKRQREDERWNHDLFKDNRPQIKSMLSGGDLRRKLQWKNNQQDTQSGGVRDLRDLLSGSVHSLQVKKDAPKPKPVEASKPAKRKSIVESTVVDLKKDPNLTSKKKTRQKADASVDEFLQSLGLEKYQISLQAEEVDMAALEHMTDEDLKAMGIPMGPRKKIISALNSRGH